LSAVARAGATFAASLASAFSCASFSWAEAVTPDRRPIINMTPVRIPILLVAWCGSAGVTTS
jgi:hypothetical protein